jgi:hypothetical protein
MRRLCIAWLLLATTAFGMVRQTQDGKTERFWDNHILVYAETSEFKPVDNRVGVYTLKVRIKAVVTGDFDPASGREIVAEMYLHYDDSAPVSRGKSSSSALVLLEREGDGYRVPSYGYRFMPPHGSAVLEVTGFDDPKVAVVIKHIRKLRFPIIEEKNHNSSR